jgi:excisionase family DNA binding protein
MHTNAHKQCMEKFLCAKDVANLLGVQERLVRRLFVEKQIEGFRVGGKLWRCRRVAIEAYIERETARYRLPPCA